MNKMKVLLLLCNLSVTIYGASIHLEQNETPDNLIDGIEKVNLPTEYKDVAMICDLFKKLNALTVDVSSGASTTHEDDDYDNSEDSDTIENDETDFQEMTLFADNLKEWIEEMKVSNDENWEKLGEDVNIENEQIGRKERVRRANSDAFPKELLDILHGVCVTDKCIRILQEYYEWRQTNGYPVYTGVSQIAG